MHALMQMFCSCYWHSASVGHPSERDNFVWFETKRSSSHDLDLTPTSYVVAKHRYNQKLDLKAFAN
jgi:hypothetical protein